MKKITESQNIVFETGYSPQQYFVKNTFSIIITEDSIVTHLVGIYNNLFNQPTIYSSVSQLLLMFCKQGYLAVIFLYIFAHLCIYFVYHLRIGKENKWTFKKNLTHIIKSSP